MRTAIVTLLAAASLAAQPAPADLNRVKVGEPAPDFTLESADSRTISLSQLRGKRVVLIFYRGHW